MEEALKTVTSHLVAAALLAVALPASALQITNVSPQGEVAQVRQLVVKFNESAVTFGDAQAAAPVTLSCSDAQATRGNGRWTSDREWAFEFENDLPPGVRCAVQVKSGFKSPKGAELATGRFAFNTGGPFVQQVRPGSSSRARWRCSTAATCAR